MTLAGLDVDVTGIARVLPARHVLVPCGGERKPESLCEDPDLPLPPIAQPNLPSVSITVFKIVDHRWLEVKGRVSPLGAVRAIRAGSVSLIARPPDAEAAPCAP